MHVGHVEIEHHEIDRREASGARSPRGRSRPDRTSTPPMRGQRRDDHAPHGRGVIDDEHLHHVLGRRPESRRAFRPRVVGANLDSRCANDRERTVRHVPWRAAGLWPGGSIRIAAEGCGRGGVEVLLRSYGLCWWIHLHGNAPQVSMEVGRKMVPTEHMPSFLELEEAVQAVQMNSARSFRASTSCVPGRQRHHAKPCKPRRYCEREHTIGVAISPGYRALFRNDPVCSLLTRTGPLPGGGAGGCAGPLLSAGIVGSRARDHGQGAELLRHKSRGSDRSSRDAAFCGPAWPAAPWHWAGALRSGSPAACTPMRSPSNQ